MKNQIKLIGYFIWGLTFVSCHATSKEKNNYPQNLSISNAAGLPKCLTTFYFPDTIRQDTITIKTEIDSFLQNWYSSALYAAKEPILFNFYLGHDIYRFLLLRSFHRPVVFSLHRDRDKVWLTTKELNKQPEFMDQYSPSVKFIAPRILPDEEDDTTKVQIKDQPKRKTEARRLIRKADRKAEIVLNQTINLTENEWREFEVLLNNCAFWSSKPYIESMGCDGSQWIIEGHLKNKYWLVNRWSPDGDFRKAGEYLIQKSGFKEEIY